LAKRLFGTQGLRGIVNETVTSTVAHDVGLAFASYLGGRGVVAIAWDSRVSSEMLSHAVASGLMAGGCSVRLLGLAPTPLLSFTIPRLGCDAGVMITASHNPPQFNGIKLWGSDGAALPWEEERKVELFYFKRRAGPKITWDRCGRLQPTGDLKPRYMRELYGQIDRELLARRGFQIVADCGGGAASAVIPGLLEKAGCKVEVLHCEPDGLFQGRLPEPKEANLQKLISKVKDTGADLGVAWDGDADRVIFITGEGRFLMGDRSFALAAYHRLNSLPSKERKRIVTQVATSDVIRDVAARVGAEVVLTKVGEPNIVATMKRVGAQIGGEENGGVIYRGWSWTREGLLTTLTILDLMAKEEETLERLDRRFPSYYQVKDSIPCPDEYKGKLLERVAAIAPSDAEKETLDGIKLRYTDGWLLLRPSGTEPIFRIFTEAKTKQKAQQLPRNEAGP